MDFDKLLTNLSKLLWGGGQSSSSSNEKKTTTPTAVSTWATATTPKKTTVADLPSLNLNLAPLSRPAAQPAKPQVPTKIDFSMLIPSATSVPTVLQTLPKLEPKKFTSKLDEMGISVPQSKMWTSTFLDKAESFGMWRNLADIHNQIVNINKWEDQYKTKDIAKKSWILWVIWWAAGSVASTVIKAADLLLNYDSRTSNEEKKAFAKEYEAETNKLAMWLQQEIMKDVDDVVKTSYKSVYWRDLEEWKVKSKTQMDNIASLTNSLMWEYGNQMTTYLSEIDNARLQALADWNQSRYDQLTEHREYTKNTIKNNMWRIVTDISKQIYKDPSISNAKALAKTVRSYYDQWYTGINEVMTAWLKYADWEYEHGLTYQDFLNNDAAKITTDDQWESGLNWERGWYARKIVNDFNNVASPLWQRNVRWLSWFAAAEKSAIPFGSQDHFSTDDDTKSFFLNQLASADLWGLYTENVSWMKKSTWDMYGKFWSQVSDVAADAIPTIASVLANPQWAAFRLWAWLKAINTGSKVLWTANKLQIALNVLKWVGKWWAWEMLINAQINSLMANRNSYSNFAWDVWWWLLWAVMDIYPAMKLVNNISTDAWIAVINWRIKADKVASLIEDGMSHEDAVAKVLAMSPNELPRININSVDANKIQELQKTAEWFVNNQYKAITNEIQTISKQIKNTADEWERTILQGKLDNAIKARDDFNVWVKTRLATDEMMWLILSGKTLSKEETDFLGGILKAATNTTSTYQDMLRIIWIQKSDSVRNQLRESVISSTSGRFYETTDNGFMLSDFQRSTWISPYKAYTREELEEFAKNLNDSSSYKNLLSIDESWYKYWRELKWETPLYELSTEWLKQLKATDKTVNIRSRLIEWDDVVEDFKSVIDEARESGKIELDDLTYNKIIRSDTYTTLLDELNRAIPCI